MTVIPHGGEWHGWIQILEPRVLRVSTFSVLTGIERMWNHGAEGLAGLLFAFSVAFPTAKLAILGWTAAHPDADARHGWAGWLAHHVGKFSMLDVLVIGLIVVAVKGLPGNTEVVAGWALWAFAASVLLAMGASLLLHTGGREPRPSEKRDGVRSDGAVHAPPDGPRLSCVRYRRRDERPRPSAAPRGSAAPRPAAAGWQRVNAGRRQHRGGRGERRPQIPVRGDGVDQRPRLSRRRRRRGQRDRRRGGGHGEAVGARPGQPQIEPRHLRGERGIGPQRRGDPVQTVDLAAQRGRFDVRDGEPPAHRLPLRRPGRQRRQREQPPGDDQHGPEGGVEDSGKRDVGCGM